MNRGLLIAALSVAAGCADDQRGGYCYRGSCTLADGGTYVLVQACQQYQCYSPADAPSAGVQACQRFLLKSDAGCVGVPACSARFLARPDVEDCNQR